MRTRPHSNAILLAALAVLCPLLMNGCFLFYGGSVSVPFDPSADSSAADPRSPVAAAIAHRAAQPHSAHKRAASAQLIPATGPTVTSSVAPFLGNLSLIQSANQFVTLQRQADCSLTYGSYAVSGAAPGPFTVTSHSQVASYEKTIHANAFLTTTPDVFPNGCTGSNAGLTSQYVPFMGMGKTSDYLGASVGTSGNYYYTFNLSLGTPGMLSILTPQDTDIAPISLTYGDLNGDGNPDIVSLNTDGINSSVSVSLGKADGTYIPAVNYDLTGQVISWGVLDDLNGDDKLDLIVIGSNTFTIYLGKGDGTFITPPVVFSTGAQTVGFNDKFITADVNGDNKKDIITQGGLVFLGDGSGTNYTFKAAAFPRVNASSSDLAPGMVAADFNHDNKMDLAIDDGQIIHIYTGNGDGTFNVGRTYAALENRGLISATDLDGDGNIDLLSGFGGGGSFLGDDYTSNQQLAVMGNGDGTFQGAPYLPAGYSGSNLADLNGDGRPDLVGVSYNGTSFEFDTYLTDASGVPVATGTPYPIPINEGADSFVLGAFDTNSSTNQDLMWIGGQFSAESFYLALGDGTGKFGAATQIPVPSLVPAGNDINESITGLHAADINHDGKLDIIYSFEDQSSTSSTYYEGFAVQLGNGDGTFGAPKIVYTYQSLTAPTFAFSNLLSYVTDVTGDNFPDVFMVIPPATVGNPNITELFVGNGDGTFKAPNTLTLVPSIIGATADGTTYGNPFAAADLNGDGKMDLVATGSSADGTTPQFAVAIGNGDGTFKPPTIYEIEGFGYPAGPAIGDFNGDHKLDLYIGGAIQGVTMGIFPGNGDGTFEMISNGDGTVTPPDVIAFTVGGSAVGVDLNKDGALDLIAGSVILINKSGAAPVLAPTTTTVSSSLNPSTVGANVTFTATVTSTTAGTITGSVNFFDGATQIGSGTIASGSATYATTALTQGPHTITAVYVGDTNYATSTSAAITQTVNAAAAASTTTTVSSSLNPSTVGASVTFTASVTSATAGTITGTVNFFDGATMIGSGTLAAGSATYATSTLTQGPHSITAKYVGNATYATSTSSAITQTVNAATKASTNTVVVSTMNPSVYGNTIGMLATVTSATAGNFTGTVSFYNGATLIATESIQANGTTDVFTPDYNVGPNSITAQYSGDANYAASTSAAIVQTVTIAPTTTTLTGSPTNAPFGTTISFTATTKTSGSIPISGTVNLVDTAGTILTGQVGAGGITTFTTTTLSVGSHSITAQYVGNTDFVGSTSAAVPVTITSVGTFALSANPSTVTVHEHTPGMTVVSVTPSGGFNQPVTLSCTAPPAGFSCAFAPAVVTPNGGAATSTLTIADALTGDASRARRSAIVIGVGGNGSGTSGSNAAASRRLAFALRNMNASYAFALGGELMLLGLLFVRRRKMLARDRALSSGDRSSLGARNVIGGTRHRDVSHGIGGPARLAYALLVLSITATFVAGCAGPGPSQMSSVTITATTGGQTVTLPLTLDIPK